MQDIIKLNEQYKAKVELLVKTDKNNTYKEIWNIKDKSFKLFANEIKIKYLNFYERKYDDIIKNFTSYNANNITIKIKELQVENKIIDVNKKINLDGNIMSDVGIKNLNQKFEYHLDNISLENLASDFIKVLDIYSYECDTDMESIKILINKIKIRSDEEEL